MTLLRRMPALLPLPLLLPLACALALPHAQAQSTPTAYTATTLQGPWFDATSLPAVQRFDVDAQQRVWGTRGQFSIERYLTLGLSGGSLAQAYVPRAASWAPSTATSVSPSGISGASGNQAVATVSDDGQWVVLRDTSSPPVYRVLRQGSATRVMPPAGTQVDLTAINRQGEAAGTLLDLATGHRLPVLWRQGQFTRLPLGNMDAGMAVGINNQGVIVGQVNLHDTQVAQLALWTNGQLSQPLAGSATPWSAGRAINDRGTLVVLHGAADGSAGSRWSLLTPAGLQALSGATEVADLNASDVVLGQAEGGTLGQQAAMWVQGQRIDLSARLAGITLPAGTLVLRGLGLNDQGSMVLLHSRDGGRTQVLSRVQPKP